jgi:predicted permease
MAEWRTVLADRCAAAALEGPAREVVQRELEEHLQDRFEDLVSGGASAAAADRAVAAEVPDVAAIRALARSRPGHGPATVPAPPLSPPAGAPLATIGRDVRFALRLFLKDRTFTLAAIGTLALCLAANVAVFALVNSAVFRALDVPYPEQLLQLSNGYPGAGVAPSAGGNSGVPDYFDRLAGMPAMPQQALFRRPGVSLGDTDAQRVSAMLTTPSLFPMLGAQAALGRTFTEDEGEEGRDRKVVLSDALWRQRFGGAPDVIGRTVAIGGIPHEIVGVMPAGFRFYDDAVDLWLPAAFSADDRSDNSRHNNSWVHVGRLAPGATIEQAVAQVNAINAANLERFPGLRQALIDAQFHTRVERVTDVLVASIRRPLTFLWAGVAAVLLIGVVNLVALTLARSTSRRGEIATRLALGAQPARLRQQLITEHLILAMTGGAAGIALGLGVLQALPRLGIAFLPAERPALVAPIVWIYAVGLTIAVGLVLGGTAARSVRRVQVATTLRDDGRSRTGTRAGRRLRQALVVGQVAAACALLVASGLLFSSFRRLMAVDPGFDVRTVTGAVSLPRSAYPDDAARLGFARRLLEGARALPGTQTAGLTDIVPFGDSSNDSVIWAEDQPPTPGTSLVSPFTITVSPGYFAAMDVPIVAGRDFTTADDHGEPVVIVDERLARRFWSGREAVGRRLIQPQSSDAIANPTPENTRAYRVVGVVADVKQRELVTPASHVGTYYFSADQNPPSGFWIAVRSSAAPTAVEADLRRLVAGLDPRLPLFDVNTMQDRVQESVGARRATMLLAVGFGALALLLSAVGLYGVLAFLVAQRTREIGIRMALGGSAPAIAGLVLRESAVVVGVGVVLGLAGSAWVGRALASQLVEVGALDPAAIVVALALLVLAAVAASAAPTRRALHVDPAVTLAAE